MDNFPPDLVSTTSCPSKGVVYLAKGEFMVKCPYDNNHLLLEHRFYQHLEKCRRNYTKKCLEDGAAPFKLSCKYDYRHQILAPELLYHEHRCPNKDKLILEFLLSDRQEINRILEKEKAKPTQNGATSSKQGKKKKKTADKPANDEGSSLDAIRLQYNGGTIDISQLAWDLIDLGKIEEHGPRPIPIGEVAWSDPKVVKEQGISPFKKPDDELRLTQEEEPLFYKRRTPQRRRYKVRNSMPPKLNKVEEEEEEEDSKNEEYWKKKTRSSFDWLRHQYTHKAMGPFPGIFPPGLTKAERKEFVKIHAERLKTEFGVFDDEELELQPTPQPRALPAPAPAPVLAPDLGPDPDVVAELLKEFQGR